MASRALRRILRNYLLTVLGAGLAALVCRSFFLEAYRISGNSMSPALLRGDHVLVWKAPWVFSNARPPRGSIVLFSPPEDPDRPYLRRVVGLPGETVHIRAGKLEVNGAPESLVLSPDWTLAAVAVPEGFALVIPEQKPLTGASTPSSRLIPLSSIHGEARWIWLSIAPLADASATKSDSGFFSRLRFHRLFSKVRS